MNIKPFKYTSVVAITCLASLLSVLPLQTPKAYADCGFWDTIDPTNRSCPIPSPTARDFDVSIQNNSNDTILVAVHYYVEDTSRGRTDCSTIDGRGNCGDSSHWTTEGYWKLEPGQKAYVVDTVNSIIYFHAHNENGTSWGDRNTSWSVGNDSEPRPFFKVNMGENYSSFTQVFK